MPDLEYYRKQAKQILRWHQDRTYTVAQQIRHFLPRFAGLADEDILARAFKLADAQELVARQQGFESWQALKTGLETLAAPTQQQTQAVFLLAASPHIQVRDMDAACDFYTQKLGFRVLFKYGNPPFFGVVTRDAAELRMRCVHAPLIDQALRDREQLLSASISLRNRRELEQLYSDFDARGVTFLQALKKQPYGGRDFIVKDPDGNLIGFGCGGD